MHHDWSLVDVLIVLAGWLGGWGVHTVCWVRNVNTNLNTLNIGMSLMLRHIGIEWSPKEGVKDIKIRRVIGQSAVKSATNQGGTT